MNELQVTKLHSSFDLLQNKYGAKDLSAIYGAGKLVNPKVMFIFMNPTARNYASYKQWQGLKAPWLATKNIWDLFYPLDLISEQRFQQIKELKAQDWTPTFALSLYKELAANNVYITNLAKCTQIDARPLPNSVFHRYLELMHEEIDLINPQNIITFGNQVSSIIINRSISVSNFLTPNDFIEMTFKNKKYNVYPTYYPVGQGRRNIEKAILRIKSLLA